MELVEKNALLVGGKAHLNILAQCEEVNGHLEVLIHALHGMVQGRDGETIGHLKALENVANNARNALLEMESMIEKLRE